MKGWIWKMVFFPWLLIAGTSDYPSSPSLRAMYARLFPNSLTQNLSFYELYPETKEGRMALRRVSKLLCQEDLNFDLRLIPLSSKLLNSIVYSFSDDSFELSEKELQVIDSISSHLKNRSLQGRKALSEEEVFSLPKEEIDISRALLLLTHAENPHKIKIYEAYLDFMALHILASLPKEPTPKQMIQAINEFIFFEMHFKFPPHALWAKDIDHYTFLPSVIDKRKGVCLGVSILYLSLAQRLGLPLEIITPPGHIYVRYGEEKNIETTARGIHIPSDHYLGIDTYTLQKRTQKEVIGLALMNEASVKWSKKEYQKSAALYEKALKYIPQDPLALRFLGYNYLFLGRRLKGEKILKSLRGKLLPFSLYSDHVIEDYLDWKVDAQGIEALYEQVDETKESILKKQEKLKKTLKKYPHFRSGLLHLAGTYLQLGNETKALEPLEKLFSLDPENPTVNYYLSALYLQRNHFPKAWKHLHLAEAFLHKKKHFPKALKAVREELARLSFEP